MVGFTRVLTGAKPFLPESEMRWKKKKERFEALEGLTPCLLVLKMEEGSHKSRNMGGLQKLEIVLGWQPARKLSVP